MPGHQSPSPLDTSRHVRADTPFRVICPGKLAAWLDSMMPIVPLSWTLVDGEVRPEGPSPSEIQFVCSANGGLIMLQLNIATITWLAMRVGAGPWRNIYLSALETYQYATPNPSTFPITPGLYKG